LISTQVYSQEFIIDEFINFDTIVNQKIKQIEVNINKDRLFAIYKYDTITRNIYEYYLAKNVDTLYPKYNKDYNILYQVRHHYNEENKIDSLIKTKYSSDSLTNNISSIAKYYYYKNAIKTIKLTPFRGKYFVKSSTLDIYDSENSKIITTHETDIGGYIEYYQYVYVDNKLVNVRSNDMIFSSFDYNDLGLKSKAVEGLSVLTYFYNEKNLLEKYEIYNDDKGYIDFIYPGRRTFTFVYNENNLVKEITINHNDNLNVFTFKYLYY
jgi:hypothetical protein